MIDAINQLHAIDPELPALLGIVIGSIVGVPAAIAIIWWIGL